MVKWLAVLFIFLFVLIVSHSAQLFVSYTFKNMIVFQSLNALQWISGMGLVGLLVSPFLFPSILYGLPQYNQSGILNDNANQQERLTASGTDFSEDMEASKKSTTEYKAEYLEHLGKISEKCMDDIQPYLQSDCNVAYFAKLVNIPAHHLAYYFKEVRKQSFNDFRNEWRVKHATELIRQGKTNKYTMEAIGVLSGFSSKNAFFMAFKKIEGTTPGTYAEQLNS
jgi:YesN/AraC family two-component response regulator